MRYWLAGLCCLITAAIWIVGNLTFQRMKEEVNARLPQTDRISEWGSSFERSRVLRLHKEMCPRSYLRRRYYQLWTLGAVLGITAMVLIVRFV
jgi:hypothetical protein